MSTSTKVTIEQINGLIVSEYYFTAREGVQAAPHSNYSAVLCGVEASLGLLTFCVLVLKNDFTVTGESACVSPDNFNAEVGRKVARENAIAKIWLLEGYRLKSELHQAAGHA